jgi:transposase
MLNVETIRKVRQAHHRDGKGIREIARLLNLSRNTVRSIIRSGIIDQKYERSEQPRPKLGLFVERLSGWLKEDADKPVKHRRRAQILFEQLQREGYDGGYDAVRRYVGTWKKDAGTAIVNAFIPLEWDPGDAFQFDWSYEDVELGGMPVKVKVAQFRLCNSRKPFCVAYTRESLPLCQNSCRLNSSPCKLRAEETTKWLDTHKDSNDGQSLGYCRRRALRLKPCHARLESRWTRWSDGCPRLSLCRRRIEPGLQQRASKR